MGGELAGDVFAEHIELDIQAATGMHGFEVGDFDGMWDDPAGHAGVGDLCGGQGNAVKTNGAFGDDQLAVLGSQRHGEAVVGTVWTPIENAHGGIDMALNKVATESVADLHGAFKIDEAADGEVAEAGDAQGLGQQIKGKGRGGEVDSGDGETAAIDGNAIARGNGRDEGRCGAQGEAGAAGEGGFGEREDFASGFYKAGEHDGNGAKGGTAVERRLGWRDGRTYSACA